MDSIAKGRILLSRDGNGSPVLRFGTSCLRRPPDRPLYLGGFPSAPAISLEPSSDSKALIRIDPFGAFPLFIAGTPAVIGDSLPEVAAHAEATGIVDLVSVVGRIAFEFDIGPHTLLEGVRRILPTEVAEIDFETGRTTIANATPGRASPDPLSFLVEMVGSAFQDGADVELSGGCDSRLVLALGCAAGVRPRTAVTMGQPGSFDVDCAAAIAEDLGIPHRIEPFPSGEDPDWESIRRFWLRSGCSIDPLEYAWVPTTFGSRFPHDRTQLSGVGGEIASGFYAFRGDETSLRLAGWQRLIRYRMAKRRHLLASMGREGTRLLELAIDRVTDRIEGSGTWREFGLRMYVEERCRSWAGSVLAASSMLYRPLAPLLTPEYRSLCEPAASREHGRAWQHELIGRLEPRLLRFPFQPKWSTLRKLRRRWSGPPASMPRPHPVRQGDGQTRDAFELGCFQAGWSPDIAAVHPGTVLGIGWLEVERAAILRELARGHDTAYESLRPPA